MLFNKTIEEIDSIIKRYESARDYCINAYKQETEAGKMDAFRWLAVKKYWNEKISLLKEIKELIQEFNELRVE